MIGGYLGAGKTTLVNRLLSDSGGRRLAVLVNDFGAINVDAGLVSSRSGETISLTNGCVCCSMGGELLFELAGLRDRDDPPEHVIIEASGVGDPAAIAMYGAAGLALRYDGGPCFRSEHYQAEIDHLHGEGVQQVRSMHASWGGRW